MIIVNKILFILDSYKYKLPFMAALLLLASILDILSISLLPGLIPLLIEGNDKFNFFFGIFDNVNKESFLGIFSLIVI